MSRTVLAAALLAAGTAGVAIAGPPWIAIESPANPLDPETRNAAFVVRVYHHSTPASIRVSGTAEGLVAGKRQSRALTLTSTSVAGRYAVARQWPDQGVWIVLVTLHDEHEIQATAIVDIGSDGAVTRVRVPSRAQGDRTFPERGPVSMKMIDRELEARAALAARGR